MKVNDVKAVRAYFSSQVASLNGLLETLTGPLKESYQRLRDDYNAILEKLPPLEQQDAAQQVNWGLDCLVSSIERANEVIAGLQGLLKQKAADHGQAMQALQSKVTDFESRLNTGELISKGLHAELLSAATTKAATDAAAEAETRVRGEITAAAERAKLIEGRKSALSVAGLPVPGESILGLEESAFTTASTEAKRRVDELKAKGVRGDSTLLNRAAWSEPSAYTDLLSLVDEALSSSAKPPGRKAEPMAGGSSGSSVPLGVI